LWRSGGAGYIDTQAGYYNGLFVLVDEDYQPGLYYYLRVTFEHVGAPATYDMVDVSSSIYYFFKGAYYMTSEYSYLGHLSMNAAGDTTSLAGDVSSAWTTVFDTLTYFEEEGETRQRKEYGSGNDYDLITVQIKDWGDTSYAFCSTSKIGIDTPHPRTYVPAHELGHILHGRVVGCSGNPPAFPWYGGDPGGWSTGTEGGALGETTSALATALWLWDPDTASTVDMLDLDDCAWGPASLDNANMAIVQRNNWYGLWELIDTDTSNNEHGKSDAVDLTLADLYDGMETWQATSGGGNHAADEFTSTAVNPTQSCSDADDCDPGDACYDGQCWYGDVHGGNIDDWAYHISGGTFSARQDALSSSPCLGVPDNSYTFNGGFRSD
jgi:hypothetical protein